MKTKLLFSLVCLCALSFVSTAFAKPIPTTDARVSAVQPVRKGTPTTAAVPGGGAALLRTGDPIDYVSIVVEQDSTSGELEQRLRIDQHTGTYACRDIPDVEDERCCSESLSQKLRMHRIQANSIFNAEQVDLRGICQMTVDQGGNQSVQHDPLFGGQELHALTSYNWQYLNLANAVDGSELRFDNNGCLGPDCADFNKMVSNHDVDALIVLGGQDLNMLLLEKGIPEDRVAGIVDGLRDIVDSPTWPYRYWVDIDASGIVHLNYPAYQQGLIFYEQIEAGSDKNDPDYDYADASYWFWVMCGDLEEENIAPPQEVVIRDSIGPDASTVAGNYIFSNADGPDADNAALISIDGGETGLQITKVEFVGDNTFPFLPVNWSLTQFSFKMWNSVAETNGAGHETGTIYNFPVSLTELPPVEFFDPQDHSRRLMVFDLSQNNVVVPANSTKYFAIPQVNGAPSSSGFVGIPESTESGPSDYYIRPSSTIPLMNVGGSTHSGRFGVRITAIPLS